LKFALIGPVYPFRGGIAHYTTMLCRTLRERGHDVLPVSFKRQYPQWLFPGQSDRDPSKKPLKVEGARYWIDSLNPITWLTAFWRIRRYQPNVIILQWWTTFWAATWFVLGALNRLFLQRPLIYICHNVLPHEVRPWDPLLTRVVLQWGTCLIVQSIEEERQLISLVPDARVAVMPHPVYDMFASARISRDEARRQLGLPLDAPVLLFFGIVREYKGLRDILAALPDIQARLRKVTLIVAGEFWEDKQPYLEMIERLGIGDSVVIEDRYILNEEVPLYFSATDVLVAPYRRTTGSGVVQLGVGFGVPTITTAVEHLSDTLQNPYTGLIVPPGDIQALAAAIIRHFAEDQGAESKAIEETRMIDPWCTLVRAVEGVNCVGSAGVPD
jgi:glycosyltransferase involved in cell wall biosynthesis